MRRLALDTAGPLAILAVGAHADDIEIGAGATILRLLGEHQGSRVLWVIASATPERAAEGRTSAAAFTTDAVQCEVIVADLPDGRLPDQVSALKDLLESTKPFSPDLILSPRADDAHQDHQIVAQTVWQTFRNHLVAEYEIPKYDGDLGRPNVYVAIDEQTLTRKVDLLHAHFPSQHGRTWWGGDTVRALARLRGIESTSRFAEAFHCRKIVL